MAERQVSVRLSAVVTPYIKAMDEARAATKKLENESTANMARLGSSMTDVGQKMSLGVTLPLVGVGTAAVKASMDFDRAFSQMVGLAGVPAGEVAELKEAVLGLAGETARPPQELAEALYFLRSSGLDGSAALDALEYSAKASAAGLGNTAVVADAVSSAMNAYASSGLGAAEATDILVGAARAGKAEPEQLAGALGRILPVSAELGVSFEDVGGAIAALSLNGNDAAQSSTLLTNVLMKMLKPSQQGAEALAEVGLSTDAIRSSIAEQGLLGTLEMLRERLGDSGFTKFLEDQQAVLGGLALTGENGKIAADALDTVKASAGGTEAAFEAIPPEVMAIQQAWSDMQSSLIQVGAILGPVVADLAGGVSSLLGWFTELDPALQMIVVGLGGLAAVAGPLLMVLGSIVRNLAILQAAFVSLRTVMATHPLLAIGAVLTTAAVAFGVFGAATDNAGNKVDELADQIREAESAIEGLDTAILNEVTSNDQLREAMKASGLTTSDLSAAIRAGGDDLRSFGDRLREGADAAGMSEMETWTLLAAVSALAEANAKAATDQDELNAVTEEGSSATAGAAKAQSDYVAWLESRHAASRKSAEATETETLAEAELTAEREAAIAAMQEQVDAINEMIDAQLSAVDATYGLRDAEDEFRATVAEVDDRLAKNEDGLYGIRDIMDDVAQSAQDVADAEVRLATEMAAAEGRTLSATERVDIMNQSLLEQAATLTGPARQALVEHIAQLNGIPVEVASEVLTLIDQGKVDEANAKLAEVSRTRQVSLEAVAITDTAADDIARLVARRTVDVDVRLTPRALDSGGYGLPGDTVAERRPEFVNGRLVTSMTRLSSPAWVTGGAETAAILAGARMTPAGLGVVAPRSTTSTDNSRAVHFNGDVIVRDESQAVALAARASVALGGVV